VALQRLAPELRAVIQATVLDGLTSREAAVLLAIPANTVKTPAPE
jgi:RNA polymerase sigma-70 factor (ECF subfamily)